MKSMVVLFVLLFVFPFDQIEKDFYSRGIQKSDMSDHYGAIAEYTKAIELDPEHDLAYYNRAVEKAKLGKLEGAIVDFTRAIEIKPSFEAFYYRGKIKATMENHQAAVKDYTKAIELNPLHIGCYFDRGLSKLMLGEMESGRLDLKRARRMGRQEISGIDFIREN